MGRKPAWILKIFGISMVAVFPPFSPAQSGALVEEAMREARKAAEHQQQVIITLRDPNDRSVALAVFYNSLIPFEFCYGFIIEGDWDWEFKSEEGNVFTTDAGYSKVMFSIMTRQELEAAQGTTDQERAVFILDQQYATRTESLGLAEELTSSKGWLDGLAVPVMTWRLAKKKMPLPSQLTMTTPSHYLSPAPNRQILNIMVMASSRSREDDIARIFLERFRTTQDPECYFPALRAMYQSLEK